MSELQPTAPPAKAHPETADAHSADAVHWRDLVTQVGSEVAGPLTSALERLHKFASTGRIERESLRALREELELARQAGMIGQQLARFGSGRIRQAQEKIHLTQMLNGVLTHRTREIQARGLRIEPKLAPVEIIADASLLFGLLNNVLDWAIGNAEERIELQIDLKAWPAHARLLCKFGHRRIDDAGEAVMPASASGLDSLNWRLLEQIAWTMELTIERVDEASHSLLTLTFPHTIGQHADKVSALELNEGFSPSTNSKPLAGSQILVVAARRDVRNQVREAIHPMGLIVDFVHSVAEAAEFCSDGLPHAVIYEAALAGERFRDWRTGLLNEVPTLAFIEIVEEGSTFTMSGYGGDEPARIGRDVIATSLPSALMFELSKTL